MDFVKQILAFAFSQVGVVVLCVMYAVGGARIYMSMEVQNQNNTFQTKFILTFCPWRFLKKLSTEVQRKYFEKGFDGTLVLKVWVTLNQFLT